MNSHSPKSNIHANSQTPMAVETMTDGTTAVPCCDVRTSQVASIGGVHSMNVHVPYVMVSSARCNQAPENADIPANVAVVDVEIVVP